MEGGGEGVGEKREEREGGGGGGEIERLGVRPGAFEHVFSCFWFSLAGTPYSQLPNTSERDSDSWWFLMSHVCATAHLHMMHFWELTQVAPPSTLQDKT